MEVEVAIADQRTHQALTEIAALPKEFSLYLVGGSVRDLLLKGSLQDVDLVTDGDPWAAARLLASRWRGTAFEMHPEPLTLRVTPKEADLPQIDLLRPSGSLEDDLRRRDFTVNAMAAKLLQLKERKLTLELMDPCGGAKDLSQRIIRPVSESAFLDDPVRMLRCFRLACSLEFKIAPEAISALQRNRQFLTRSAPERIRDELLSLLGCTPCFPWLEKCLEAGLPQEIIPELRQMEGVQQDGYHHLDVYQHTLETVRQLEEILLTEDGWIREDLKQRAWRHLQEQVVPGISRLSLLKLAALLHDVAKPQTKTVEPDGRTHFIGHNLLGAEVAREVGWRLRLGKRSTETLAKMVREHLRPGLLASEPTATPRATNRFLSQMGDLAVEVLLLELADRLATRGPATAKTPLEKHVQFTNSLLAAYYQAPKETPPPLLDGHEVMARYSLSPGPVVGKLLALAKEAQEEGQISTKEEALAFLDEAAATLGFGKLTTGLEEARGG